MTAKTDYSLTAALEIQQGEQSGVFGIVNRTTGSQVITIVATGNERGQETITLDHVGDSVSFDLANYRSLLISADSYPCRILLLNTNLDMTLNAAPVINVAPAPAGAVTFHADVTIVGATTTVLYTPTTGSRFILTDIEISTDTAGRVMVVDDADSAGQRLFGGYFAANGGAAVTQSDAKSGAVNRVAKVVTAGAGNTFVSVDGYEQVG